jgi:hypothetical protein
VRFTAAWKRKERWHAWYAWYPIDIDGEWIWLETLERRAVWHGMAEVMPDDHEHYSWEYRLPCEHCAGSGLTTISNYDGNGSDADDQPCPHCSLSRRESHGK